jgi:hypothetical protein
VEAGVLEAESVLVADHGVGLAGAGGSVGKDGGVESVEYGFDEGVCCFEIDLNAGRGTFSLVWLR